MATSDVRKFMVGYEMLARPQGEITSEAAAATLRNLNPIHYAERKLRQGLAGTHANFHAGLDALPARPPEPGDRENQADRRKN